MFFRRFMKWTGLNRSTAYHVRIRGLTINRFALSVGLAAIGVVVSMYGYKAIEKYPHDILVFILGCVIVYVAYHIDKRWFREMFSESLSKHDRLF